MQLLIRVQSMAAQIIAQTFIKEVAAHYGLPEAITSDRGPHFVSQFCKSSCETLRTEQRLSSSYLKQTDNMGAHSKQ